MDTFLCLHRQTHLLRLKLVRLPSLGQLLLPMESSPTLVLLNLMDLSLSISTLLMQLPTKPLLLLTRGSYLFLKNSQKWDSCFQHRECLALVNTTPSFCFLMELILFGLKEGKMVYRMISQKEVLVVLIFTPFYCVKQPVVTSLAYSLPAQAVRHLKSSPMSITIK